MKQAATLYKMKNENEKAFAPNRFKINNVQVYQKLKPFFITMMLFGLAVFYSGNLFSQEGAVYPLQQEICKTTANFTLTWSGTNALDIDHWETNSGSGWSSLANTSSSVTFATPATDGTYLYRAYVDLGGATFGYSNYATVRVYGESAAGAGISLTYDASSKCPSDNTGTVVIATGYTGSLVNWAYSYTGSAPWNDVNQNTTTLNYDDIAQTTYYKAVIKNGVCPSVLSTNAATITVIAAPDGGVATGDASQLCEGGTAFLSVSGNVGTTLTWQKNTVDVGAGTTYNTPVNLTAATYSYRLKASSSCKNGSSSTVDVVDYSNTLTLDVAQATAVANPTGANTVAPNDVTVNAITVTPSNGSVVRWEYSPDDSQWTPLSVTATTLNYSNLTSSTYYRVVSRNGVCSEAVSNASVKITVADGGTITPSASDYCSTSVSGTIDLSDYEGTSWVWEKSVSPFAVWTTNIDPNITQHAFINLTETTKYRVNMNNGKSYSNTVTITVSSPSIAGSLSAAVSTVCSGDATSRTITLAGNTGNVVRWESSFTGAALWSPIENTNTTLSFDNLSQSAWFRAIVQNGVCTEAATSSQKITVAAGGSVSASNSVCELDASIRSLTLTGYSGVITYWEKSEYNSTTETWGAYANIGNGGSDNITYTNLSKSSRYRAVITSSCATDVTSDYATITVYSTSVGGTLSGDKTVRPSDNSGTITLTGRNGDILRWEYSLTGTGPWTPINNTVATLSYVNLAQTTYYRAVVQNGPCAENVTTNIATITAAQQGIVSSSTSICSADATSRSLTLENYLGTIDRWQKSTNSGSSWSDIAGTSGLDMRSYSGLTQTTMYRAVISADGGEIASAPATITVNPLPSPDFTFTTVCLNTQTALTNTSTIASGSIFSYDWDFGDGTGTTTQHSTHNYSTAGTYSVTVTLTSDKFCVNSVSKSVTIKPLPTVDFTFDNVCDQKSVSFINNSSISGSTLTYAWNFADGTTSTSTDPAHTFPSAGQYDIVLTALSAELCSSGKTQTIIIYENPAADFAFSNVCLNNAMSFTNSSHISTGNLLYSWVFGDGTGASTLLNPQYVYTTADTFDVELIITSQFGCKDSITKEVRAYPIPLPAFTVSNNCYGLSTTFTNGSTIADGSMTYSWDFKDGTSSTALNPAKAYQYASTYMVQLTATSDFNCAQSVQKQVAIHFMPTSNFNFSNVCKYDSVEFINYSTLNVDTLSYTWNFGNGSTSTVREPHYLYNLAGTYSVTLTATSKHGCSTTMSKSLKVWAVPVSIYSASSFCEGSTTSFANNSTLSSGSIQNVKWDFGDGNTSTIQSPMHNYSQYGIYTVALETTSDKGCRNISMQNIGILQKPVPYFTQPNVCDKDNMMFTNTSTSIVTPAVYLWDFGDETGAATSANAEYLYETNGKYNVKLSIINSNGCKDSISKEVEVYKLPSVDFSFLNPCEKNQVRFNNASVLTGGTMSFSWNLGNGSASNNTDAEATYNTYGVFPITLTATSNNGCISNTTKNVTVNQNPVASFFVQNVCYGLTSSFADLTQLQTGTMTYAWGFDDQNSATTKNPEHNYSAPGTYNVTLKITSNSGCVGEVTKATEIYPVPFVNFNSQALCVGNTMNLENVSTIESGTITYNWDFGNSKTSIEKSPGVAYSNAGAYNVKLIATSNHLCSDSMVKTATIFHAPVAAFASDTVCEGVSTSFTNQSSITSGAISYYQWNLGDLTNSLQPNPIHKYNVAGTYNVNLMVRSDKGCETNITKNIIVDYVPVPDFTADAVCLHKGMQFINQTKFPAGAPGTLSYEWSMDDLSKYIVKEPLHVYNNSGIYYAKLKVISSIGSCSDSLSKQVIVHALPLVNAGKDTTVSKGFPVILQALASTGNYLWTPGIGLNNAFELNPTATPGETTNYVLELTDNNGCKNTDSMNVIIDVDFELVNFQNSITNTITPDGNEENDKWVIPNIGFYEHHLYIYDRWGKEVYSSFNYQNNWAGTNKQGDNLPDGAYYYVITLKDSKVVLKGSITILKNL